MLLTRWCRLLNQMWNTPNPRRHPSPRPGSRPRGSRADVLEDRTVPTIRLNGIPDGVEQGPVPIISATTTSSVIQPNHAATGVVSRVAIKRGQFPALLCLDGTNELLGLAAPTRFRDPLRNERPQFLILPRRDPDSPPAPQTGHVTC